MSASFAPAVPTPNGGGPPHKLEAEKSVLGAILLSERAMYALVIEEGLQPEDFYRERHAVIYAAMLRLYARERADRPLTVTEALRQSGELDAAGGAAAVDELTGRRPRGRQRAPVRADRQRARAAAPPAERDVRDPGVASPSARAAPRELVEQAERAMLEVAHDDRQKDFRSIEEILHDELDKLHRLSRRGHVADRHAVRASRTSTRSPAASSPAT